MLEKLKEEVCAANLDLVAKGVVIYTWGNVSGISDDRKYIVIKPSGVDYAKMTPEDMVVVEAESGKIVEGHYKPSSDTPTHIQLYRAFPDAGGVTHTHSACAVAFAQAGRPLPALGTTHADYFYGDVPCTRMLTAEEVVADYEANTGKVIIEAFNGLDYHAVPGVVVRGPGPFTWGKNAAESVYHAVVLEEDAKMALATLSLNPNAALESYVLDKHYMRKHGKFAYYGQGK